MQYSATNHYTSHAPGTLVLAVTALDCWMTEYVHTVFAFGREQQRFVFRPLIERFELLHCELGNAPCPPELLSELRMLIDVRDEIVHYLPRSFGDGRQIPSWLDPLEQRGLFIQGGPPVDFLLTQKLASYALAYWACEVARDIAGSLLPIVPRPHGSFDVTLGRQFAAILQGIQPPAELHTFDALRNVEVRLLKNAAPHEID